MKPNALPIELREHTQWVCWATRVRNGKKTKVPLDPSNGAFASTADADTWGTFEEALTYATRPVVSGIGFVFTSDDPYVGVDLDDCRDPETETLSDDASDIVSRLDSYTEISPSGTGVHVICRGMLPEGQRRRGPVEMYDDGRFFTMTGERRVSTPGSVRERRAALRAVHRTYVANSTSGSTDSTEARVVESRQLTFEPALSDEQVIEKARSASNGEKFAALWDGQTSWYDSHSEADMALCSLLAFWTDGDPSRVDELFRQSGLLRPKWDEVHYADGATYGERTVERACSRVTAYYSQADSD